MTYTAKFDIQVSSNATIGGISSAVDEITAIGSVKNLDVFSFNRQVLRVEIDGGSLWDLAVTFEGLRETLASLEGHGLFELPERPDVFQAGSRVELGVSR